MAILSRDDLRKQLKRREIAPIYLLFGAETFLRDLAMQTIAEFVLTDSSLREFNETEISLNDAPIQHALASAEQLPMIASRRVVKITDVVVSANKNKDNIKEDDEKILDLYLSRPAESSVVIFVGDEIDKRRKISKLLIEKSVAVEFAALSDNELTAWAKTKLKDSNATMDFNALKLLVALVGNNVRRLTNEVEKLVTAALPDSVITYELVEELVPNSREISNFDLSDKIIERDAKGSLQVLKKILDDGAEPLMILGLISYNFRRLYLAKEMMAQGKERADVSKVMRLPYGKQEDFLATARRIEREKLTHIMKRLRDADLGIKTSKATPRLQLEMLVCELAGL